MLFRTEDIGGGIVRRTFNMGGEHVRAGRPLTRDEIVAMPAANRNALIEKRFIEVYPKGAPSAGEGKRIIANRGYGKYDVLVGYPLNDKPLTKEEAEALVELGKQN